MFSRVNGCNREDMGCCCCCTGRTKLLPILAWLPEYDLRKGAADAVAGVAVGLTVIPQAIAYSHLAGLPPQYGLYSSFMGCFVYAVFGSCSAITVGPTAVVALLTANYAKGDPNLAVLLTFVTGIVIALMGILQLGFVIDFISVPVLTGFTFAAAINIVSSQVKDLLGLSLVNATGTIVEAGTPMGNVSIASGIRGIWSNIANNLDTLRYQDTILGCVCIVALLLMREFKNISQYDLIDGSENTCCSSRRFLLLSPFWQSTLSGAAWYLSAGRNAMVVLVCILVSFTLDPDPDSSNTTFVLTGTIDSGLPSFSLPFIFDNSTLGDMLWELSSAAVVVPIVAVLEHMAVAKIFAAEVDASQELLALGLCNVAGSLVLSIPITASLSRTAVNSCSGVRTPLGGIYTGILVLLALSLLMPFCAHIPKASLAAVIVVAVAFSVDYGVCGRIYKSKKLGDMLSASVTFFVGLFWALEYGILLGVAVDIGRVLHHTARPQVQVEEKRLRGPGSEYMSVRLDRALLFPSATHVRNSIKQVVAAATAAAQPSVTVIDCKRVSAMDFTGAAGLSSLASSDMDKIVLFVNAVPEVEDMLSALNAADVVVHSEEELKGRLESDEEIFFSE